MNRLLIPLLICLVFQLTGCREDDDVSAESADAATKA